MGKMAGKEYYTPMVEVCLKFPKKIPSLGHGLITIYRAGGNKSLIRRLGERRSVQCKCRARDN